MIFLYMLGPNKISSTFRKLRTDNTCRYTTLRASWLWENITSKSDRERSRHQFHISKWSRTVKHGMLAIYPHIIEYTRVYITIINLLF